MAEMVALSERYSTEQLATLKWAIYYADGTVYTDLDGSWAEAPGWGVLAVVYRETEDDLAEFAIAHQGDFYVLADNGMVIPVGSDGLLDYAVNVFGMKSGRMVTGGRFSGVYQQAKGDRDTLIRLSRGRDGSAIS